MSPLAMLFGISTLVIVLVAVLSATVLQRAFKVHDPATTSLDLIVLVTGASSGIGLDAAIELAKQGYQVYGTVRNEKAAEKLRAIDLVKTKGQLMPIEMDVTDYVSVVKVLDKIKRDVEAGAVFVALVNNAGIDIDAPAEAFDATITKKVFDTNLFGVMNITQLFLPILRASKGRVVNLSSISGFASLPFTGQYSASKFALEGYTDALRREVLDIGVSVSLVEPGVVQSEMTKEAKFNEIFTAMSKEMKEVYAKPLSKLAEGRQNALKDVNLAKDTTTPAICHAVMSKYPKTRYPVSGFGPYPAWFAAIVAHFFPDRLQDFIILNA